MLTPFLGCQCYCFIHNANSLRFAMQLNVMWPCERLIGKYSIYTNIQSKHAQRFGPRCWCCTHATATVIRYSACTSDRFAGVERHLLLAVYKEPTHSHSHSLSLERHTHAAVRPAVDVVECSLVTPFFLRVYCVPCLLAVACVFPSAHSRPHWI